MSSHGLGPAAARRRQGPSPFMGATVYAPSLALLATESLPLRTKHHIARRRFAHRRHMHHCHHHHQVVHHHSLCTSLPRMESRAPFSAQGLCALKRCRTQGIRFHYSSLPSTTPSRPTPHGMPSIIMAGRHPLSPTLFLKTTITIRFRYPSQLYHLIVYLLTTQVLRELTTLRRFKVVIFLFFAMANLRRFTSSALLAKSLSNPLFLGAERSPGTNIWGQKFLGQR